MTLQGVVLDALNPDARPDRAQLNGTQIVRLTAFPDDVNELVRPPHADLITYHRALADAGIQCGLVTPGEAFTDALKAALADPSSTAVAREQRIQQFAAYISELRPEYLIVGNEADANRARHPDGTPVTPEEYTASWVMTEREYADLWLDAEEALHRVWLGDPTIPTSLVGCGLAAWDFPWLTHAVEIISNEWKHQPADNPVYWDFHAYEATPATIESIHWLLDPLPVTVTPCLFEYRAEPAEQTPAVMAAFAPARVEAATYFAWHTVAGLTGLSEDSDTRGLFFAALG